MTEIVEIFVLKMKNAEGAEKVRQNAHAGFSAQEGLKEWRTLKTLDDTHGVLFSDVFIWENEETAMAGGKHFSVHPDTKLYLAEVDEIIVGSRFVDS